MEAAKCDGKRWDVRQFFRQFKNGSFLLHVLVHKKSKLELIEHNLGTGYVRLIPISTFDFFRLG